MGGSPVKNNSNSDDLHKSDTESPMPPILGVLILLSVICFVIFMFKDHIKEWLHKKNITISDDLLLESNDEKKSLPEPTQEKIIELPQSTIEPTPSTEVIFELAQPQLEENPEAKT